MVGFQMEILRGWIHINVGAIREYQTALDDGCIILDFFNFKLLHFHTVLQSFFLRQLDFTEAEIFCKRDPRAQNEFKLKYKKIRIGNLNKNLGYGMGANCAHESDLNNDNEKQNDDERNPDGKHDDVE